MVSGGSKVRLQDLQTRLGPARVYVGGEGTAILLIHGGWTGARFHWGGIWEELARSHRVIAPELPGIGWVEREALPTVPLYAAWLVAVLDALEAPAAWCVGNSFGATVAHSLAGRHPERCLGLVNVNGLPMGKTPGWMLALGHTRAGRAFFRQMLRWMSYKLGVLPRAFSDPAQLPPDLPAAMRRDGETILPRFVDILVEGDGPPPPTQPVLLLWGEDDHLTPTGATRAARSLKAKLAGSKLVLLPKAGHFPQLEQPEAFVGALEEFISLGSA